ncbi:diguanylate cyclase domain-containing protein [Myxococcota bacterium]
MRKPVRVPNLGHVAVCAFHVFQRCSRPKLESLEPSSDVPLRHSSSLPRGPRLSRRGRVEGVEPKLQVSPTPTVSIGVVAVSQATSAEDVVRAADTAQQQAKDNGRNRVVSISLQSTELVGRFILGPGSPARAR